MVEVQGRRILVTGGQRGLGAAFAHELLARGADRVYVTARRPAPSNDARVVALPLDVTDERSVSALAAAVDDVSIVFNNAGTAGGVRLLTTPVDTVASIFDTNVLGPLRIAQAFAPVLARHETSAVVNIHSVLSWLAGAGAYGASKAALWSLSNSLRLELAAQHTEVVGVHLDLADTEMSARFAEANKIAPAEVATRVLDGLEQGASEILVDESSRAAKALLAGPVDKLAAHL